MKRHLQKTAILYMLAESFYEGTAPFTEDKRNAAFWFKRLASLHEPEAWHNLGLLYYYGEGVPQQKDSAAYYFRLASNQGLAESHYNLGTCYYYGHGLRQNKDSADYYFEQAFQQDGALYGKCVGTKDT